MGLASKSDLKQEDLLEVLSLGAMNNPMFALKGPAMMKNSYTPAFPLKHQQKDMRLALALGYAPHSFHTFEGSRCTAYFERHTTGTIHRGRLPAVAKADYRNVSERLCAGTNLT